ncbi:ThuA domain-containing protein [Herbidospora cretacea]|uniref:ThuA domain-containing protein n=1 Tax=Herbidospora cretacea TaxID=28444 RepID=UPI000AB931E9|nr:ThuA domain-containing protein [Herbidospora cretacea]
MRKLLIGAGAIALAATALTASPAQAADAPYDVLVFSKTAGFRHDSIAVGTQAIRDLGAANSFTVTATEDAAAFTTGNLAQYEAVVFLNTTGDVLNASQQTAFESYIRGGGGYVGVHAAADTEYGWSFYNTLAGAYFASHPAIQQVTSRTENRAHPATSHLPQAWTRTDELYNYQTNPRSTARVLATLDESTYSGGSMGGDHPITWCKGIDSGRSFYTGFGHTQSTYAEAGFRSQLLGGIRYAAKRADADCRPETGYTTLYNGSTTGWSQSGPGSFSNSDATLSSVGGMGLFWYNAKQYTSYSLKADWRLTGDSNSGVFIGFPNPGGDPNIAVNQGYEIQIDATDTADRTTGSIYGFKSADIAARDANLNPPGEWNTYELLVEGQRVRVYLNGVQVNDFTNTDAARNLDGYIGLQNHGSGDQAAFRNVRIKELGGAPICDVRVHAESFTSVSGAQAFTKAGANNGQTLGYIEPGDWAGYNNITVGGATAIRARVVSGGNGGQIQVRTGSQTGPILGTITVPNTGSWDTYADVTAALSGVPSGSANIFLTFTGTGTGLFDVDDFTFLRSCTPTVTNLALNKTATASSVEAAQYPASAAVDSSATTRWASAFADPQWIQVDLGQTYTINRVRLLWEAAYGSAYQIQTSANGTTWATVRTVTGGNGGEDDNTGLNNAARYVRIYGTARGTAWGYSLFQFEVYGS